MTKPGPGKFEANESEEIAEALYDLCGDSYYNEQYGDVEHGGWYALFVNVTPVGGHTSNYIVEEDNNGFFTYQEYASEEEAYSRWFINLAAYESHYANGENL